MSGRGTLLVCYSPAKCASATQPTSCGQLNGTTCMGHAKQPTPALVCYSNDSRSPHCPLARWSNTTAHWLLSKWLTNCRGRPLQIPGCPPEGGYLRLPFLGASGGGGARFLPKPKKRAICVPHTFACRCTFETRLTWTACKLSSLAKPHVTAPHQSRRPNLPLGGVGVQAAWAGLPACQRRHPRRCIHCRSTAP
jgi:hypothetical protein